MPDDLTRIIDTVGVRARANARRNIEHVVRAFIKQRSVVVSVDVLPQEHDLARLVDGMRGGDKGSRNIGGREG